MKLLILATFLFSSGVYAQNCNYVTLVKCFINILDDWTWTLYELRDNVVTINSEQCEHLRQLDKCIQVRKKFLCKLYIFFIF
uniref:Uncharacterized protein n=1 Tax=Panagrolaimus sp. PS1159 TaxID=55785 RepID=A0AC35FMD8_9BILA